MSTRNRDMVIQAIDKLCGMDKIASYEDKGFGEEYSIKWVDGFTPPSDKEIQDQFDLLKKEEPMKVLREERNLKLSETDWWASQDQTMTTEQKTYRQNLRDLPATSSPSLNEKDELTDVTWPVKP